MAYSACEGCGAIYPGTPPGTCEECPCDEFRYYTDEQEEAQGHAYYLEQEDEDGEEDE